MTPVSGTWEGKARGPAVGSQSHCVSSGTFMWKRSQGRKQTDLIAQDTKKKGTTVGIKKPLVRKYSKCKFAHGTKQTDAFTVK